MGEIVRVHRVYACAPDSRRLFEMLQSIETLRFMADLPSCATIFAA
jgi:hypothetical protein